MIRSFLKRIKAGTEYLNYGRHIIADWGAKYLVERSKQESRSFVVFDTGCGHGDDLVGIRQQAVSMGVSAEQVSLWGVEGYEPFRKECESKGITTFNLDIERDELPFEDSSVDVVVTNQVLEHTKEIFWIMSEFARILKPEGRLIIGVPNLASLHNRFLLLVGLHPTAQQTLSAHVRSFTLPDLKYFTEAGGFFKLLGRRGSNFYPFPPFLSRPLATLFPSMAWGLFAQFERTGRQGTFLACLEGEDNFLETPFYGSPQNPAKRTDRSAKKISKTKTTSKPAPKSKPKAKK